MHLFSNQTEKGKLKVLKDATHERLLWFYDMLTWGEKNTDNNKRSYWVTNRFLIEMPLTMVFNMPQALRQQNNHAKRRRVPLSRVPLCLLCHGQFPFDSVVLMSWLAKHQFLPLSLLKNYPQFLAKTYIVTPMMYKNEKKEPTLITLDLLQ